MSQKKADFLIILVSMAWGSSYLLMKLGLEGLGAFNLIALRFGIAFLVTALIFIKNISRSDFKTVLHSMILGLLLFGMFALLMYGLKTTSTSSAGFLISTAVVFVLLIQVIVTHKKPSNQILAGIGFTIAGIALLTLKQSFTLESGSILCILSAFTYGCYIVLTNHWTKKDDSAALGVLQLGFAGLFGLIASILFEHPSLPQSRTQWIAVLGLALVCSAFGFVTQSVAQKYTTPERTGILFSLEPVFSAVFGFFLLHEVLRVQGYIGAALVLCGVIVSGIQPSPARQKQLLPH